MKLIYSKYIVAVLVLATVLACSSDDISSCFSCQQAITPIFELCSDAQGNAVVNGISTGVPYDVYYNGLLEEGVECFPL